MISHREVSDMALVEIVELKWLLAGEGVRLHVERLQSDAEYARLILDRASASKSSILRSAAARVRRGLQLDTA
jgi:cell division protein FtsL